MRILILSLLALIFMSPSSARAACTDPVEVEGSMIYNSDYKMAQFCNGTDWIAMSGGVSSGGGGGGIPTGAVMAFELVTCPTGWSEYLPAKGRFIRGVCLDVTGCNDPDGVRAVGGTQSDLLKIHRHRIGSITAYSSGQATPDIVGTNQNDGSLDRFTDNPYSNSGSETRPINVALLYCKKN